MTPLERCAEHQARRRMCARSVVDVLLHQGRMTLEEAATYYQEKADMPESSARAALDILALNEALDRLAAKDVRVALAGRPKDGPAFAYLDTREGSGNVMVRLLERH